MKRHLRPVLPRCAEPLWPPVAALTFSNEPAIVLWRRWSRRRNASCDASPLLPLRSGPVGVLLTFVGDTLRPLPTGPAAVVKALEGLELLVVLRKLVRRWIVMRTNGGRLRYCSF
jgi:hypothetical protein